MRALWWFEFGNFIVSKIKFEIYYSARFWHWPLGVLHACMHDVYHIHWRWEEQWCKQKQWHFARVHGQNWNYYYIVVCLGLYCFECNCMKQTRTGQQVWIWICMERKKFTRCIRDIILIYTHLLKVEKFKWNLIPSKLFPAKL